MNRFQPSRTKLAPWTTGVFFALAVFGTTPWLVAQVQPGARAAEAKWQRDLVAFDNHLKSIAAAARTPTAEELRARIEKGEVEALGAAGFLDYRAPEDTVQSRLNEALKGKAVHWEFKLADDPRDYNQVWLKPRWMAKADDARPVKDREALEVIMFHRNHAVLPMAKLARGHRIAVTGTIGDASKSSSFAALHGPTAFYHPEDRPMVFWIGLENVAVTRIDPTEEELRTHVLSGKASLGRVDWKVLEVNDKTAFDERLVNQAFDGDAYTSWQTGGEQAASKHPHSLLVDIGRAEMVSGIRYVPPSDDQPGGQANGTLGSFSLHVSNSREELGDPVVTGTFTVFRVEQEVEFPPVRGRYFKLVVNSAADGSSRTSVGELNLLAPEVMLVESQRDPSLPPMAEAIERFELLKQALKPAPAALELSREQSRRWSRAHGAAGRRWDVSFDLIDEITDGKTAIRRALEEAAKEHSFSPVENANLYAAAALPEFSTEEQRAEMARRTRIMGSEHREFLAALGRILTTTQQEALKQFLADPANLLPPPKPPEPTRPTPLGDDAPAVTAVLVGPNSQWRWLHPADGVDPVNTDPDFHSTFFLPDFEENSWQTGKDSEGTSGGFGYGDSWFEGEDIGRPRIDAEGKRQGFTAYFRHRFTTTKPHGPLELRCQRDDGIIVYLDGKEVARDNVQAGEESYRLPAIAAVSGEGERTTFRLRLNLEGELPAGEHLLAISLHNPANVSSDLRIGGISLVEVESE